MKPLLTLAVMLLSLSLNAQNVDSLQYRVMESSVNSIAQHNATIMNHFPEYKLQRIDTSYNLYRFNYSSNGEDLFIEYEWALKGNEIHEMQVFATFPTMVKLYNLVFGAKRDENYFIGKNRRFAKVASTSGDYYVTAASSGTRKGYWTFFVK